MWNTLAEGPVMTERSTVPYCFVLRAEVDNDCSTPSSMPLLCQVKKYVVHTKLHELNQRGEVIAVSYCHGHYFRPEERDAAYLAWSTKVLQRIQHNVSEGVDY